MLLALGTIFQSQAQDTTPPTVSITSTTTSPTSNPSFPITFTFNEEVTDFISTDITITNATISNFQGSGAVYTANVNSTLLGSGTISVRLLAGVTADAAGNGNTASSTYNINYISPCSSSRIWIGSWIGGQPVADQPIVILTNYTATADLAGCSLQINSPAVMTIPAGFDLTISGNILINSGAQLIIESNANLIQATATTASNVGTGVTVRRKATMNYLDYVYWSSPVENQNLKNFSNETLSNRFYTIDEQTNAFVWADPESNSFSTAKGYVIRAPNTYESDPSAQQTFNGSFVGRPNAGTITIPVTASGEGYNLIGNPYPSTVNADLFLANPANQNIETLYFWTHLTSVAGGTNYATYNATGAAGASPSNTIPASETPNGFIQVGQGFIARATSPGNATFTNSMRAGNNSNQFFRTATDPDKSRIWLSVSSAGNAFNQTMVGYVPDASNALDGKFDGKMMETSGTRLYNVIDDTEYVIQGRALPFEATDAVALGFKAATAGTFSIALDNVDGLFAGEQDIFLKDNLANTLTDLKLAPYTFAAAEGTFNNRFEILFQNVALGVQQPSLAAESIAVYRQDNSLNINSGTAAMASVKVFDIRGRLLREVGGINASTATISNMDVAHQVLIVQITAADTTKVSKKVIY